MGVGKVNGRYRESPTALTPGVMATVKQDKLVSSPPLPSLAHGETEMPGPGRTSGAWATSHIWPSWALSRVQEKPRKSGADAKIAVENIPPEITASKKQLQIKMQFVLRCS